MQNIKFYIDMKWLFDVLHLYVGTLATQLSSKFPPGGRMNVT